MSPEGPKIHGVGGGDIPKLIKLFTSRFVTVERVSVGARGVAKVSVGVGCRETSAFHVSVGAGASSIVAGGGGRYGGDMKDDGGGGGGGGEEGPIYAPTLVPITAVLQIGK